MSFACFARPIRPHSLIKSFHVLSCRAFTNTSYRLQNSELASTPHVESYRKHLKYEAKQAKQKRVAGRSPLEDFWSSVVSPESIEQYELTVGIEIHAQLNTPHKLFSNPKSDKDDVNSVAAVFDLALPGSQPIFQKEVLLPALRAATALQCEIKTQSSFDRKHYFYHDQPAGYQITQYYHPFAGNGLVTLEAHDGLPPEDGERVLVGIKQVQLEQDTAKTVQQPPDTVLLDFNRVGHPLIEVISLPQIHHPKTAAAYVRKVAQTLLSVNAVTAGIEHGGLRADVNVSVRRKDNGPGHHSYSGVAGLGQRTEIKNLSSFKAVEDAVTAERNRQISILEAGGHIEGETRGWTLGSMETTRLRGKEGEVDYRYMPDPDIPPITISKDTVRAVRKMLPALPHEQLDDITTRCGVSQLDAKALIADGTRVQYFQAVLDSLVGQEDLTPDVAGKLVANWVLHELGGHFSLAQEEFDGSRVDPTELASILAHLHSKKITGTSAKKLLAMLFDGDTRPATQIMSEERLMTAKVSHQIYREMALSIVDRHADIAEKVRQGEKKKIQFLVGQMMRQGQGKLDAEEARRTFESVLEQSSDAPK